MLSPEEAAARAHDVGVPARLAALNVFRTLLRRPRAARAVADLLMELLSGRALEHRLRELVIMRIGWSTGSDYEWTQHWTIAQEVFGLGAEDLLAVRDWDGSPRFSERERAVLTAADEILATGAVSSATAECCAGWIGEDALIELVLSIGAWRSISELARSLEIPLEDGVASWPPQGVPPR
jgi:alkylhydroperoxidase family enzyme